MIDLLPTVITTVFLLIILSYYTLIFIRKKDHKQEKKFSSISIIIPAHNEEKYIAETLDSVISADFDGEKQIIVVDDGSKDRTAKIVKGYNNIKLIYTKHSGKSDSINNALKFAKGELIAIVDADSSIHKDSLIEMVKEVSQKNVAGATGVIKVKNRKKFICMWLHIEQVYNALMRSIFSKINANIATPGPLSMYRREALDKIGGFSPHGFSEDLDITIRLIRKGYRIGFSEKSVSETNMPYDRKGFFMQRTRWTRGMLNIFKKHLQLNNTIIDIYTLPIFLFTYIQAIIMGSFTVYQIISGYITYFFSKGAVFNLAVVKFFFEWFSIIGFVRWTATVISGAEPLTFVAAVGIASTLLTYPLYFISIVKYDKKIDIWHLIPVFFMFPFWLLIMIIYIAFLPEIFRRKQYNIWKKNE